MMENAPRSPDWIRQTIDGQGGSAELPRLTLAQYRSLVQGLVPTRRQIEDFVSYVAHAKSWYKHLPLWPPGIPFHFFIDPWAGLDMILQPNGEVIHVRAYKDGPSFHYSWIPTDEYRSRFGHLTFASEGAPQLLFTAGGHLSDGREVTGMLTRNWSRPTLRLDENAELQLPDEVLSAGCVALTGVIHSMAGQSRMWTYDFGHGEPDPASRHPGVKIAREIIELSSNLPPLPPEDWPGIHDETWGQDPRLVPLLGPERARLRAEMAAAVHNVVRLTS